MPETESTLRDRLATRRTALANERTLLAYVRTALMLAASGATLWRLDPAGGWDRPLGTMALAASGLVALAGFWRYARTRSGLTTDTRAEAS